MDSRVEFSDLRGRKYVYSVRKFEDFRADVPGNYIFAKRTNSGWVPLYIGETASLQKRMARVHEAWDYCRNRSASFVLAHVNIGDHKEREAEQRALMVAFDPPGNFPVPGSSPRLPDLSRAAWASSSNAVGRSTTQRPAHATTKAARSGAQDALSASTNAMA